jgi:hypothetical protein
VTKGDYLLSHVSAVKVDLFFCERIDVAVALFFNLEIILMI